MSTSFPIGPIKGAQTSIPDLDNAVYEAHLRADAVTDSKLSAAAQAALALIYAIPTVNPGDGETVWNDEGVIKVTPLP